MTRLTDFLVAALETHEAVQPFSPDTPLFAELLPNVRVAFE